MADNGLATGTPDYSAGAGVFLEQHTQNGSNPASGNNQLGPGVFQGGASPLAYGTVSNGSPVTPLYLNLQGSLPNVTSIIKNPA